MSRDRTGTAQYVPPKRGETQGHYKVRITCNDGSRPWVHLEPGPKSPQAEARARETAAHFTEDFRTRGIVAVPQRKSKAARLRSASTSETLAEYLERWIADRKARGIASVRTDEARLRTHVTGTLGGMLTLSLGHLPIRDIGRRELEQLVASLDAKVRAGELSWKSALNTWTLVAKLFDDACNAKTLALRVLEVNPAAEVRGPDRGIRRAKTYLYPSEVEQFIACGEVPLEWRRLVTLAIYLFPRAGELEVLEWDDVDVERGVIHIHRAADRAEGGVKPTKTGVARRFSIEPGLLPLLRAMRAEGGGVGRVVNLPTETNLARDLHVNLARAKVTRAELVVDDETRKRLTFHDLRATGLTWMAVRGDEPLRIMQRAGHTDFRTTQLYIREAEAIRDGFGQVFPVLPMSLLGPGAAAALAPNRPAQSSQEAQVPERIVPKVGVEPSAPDGIARNSNDLGDPRSPARSPRFVAKPANPGDVGQLETKEKDDSRELGGVVETALAEALTQAAAAGQWSTVERLAAELRARREARERNGPTEVASIGAERSKRSGGDR